MPGIGPEARHQWADSRWTRKHPDWDLAVPMHRVEGKAGAPSLPVPPTHTPAPTQHTQPPAYALHALRMPAAVSLIALFRMSVQATVYCSLRR